MRRHQKNFWYPTIFWIGIAAASTGLLLYLKDQQTAKERAAQGQQAKRAAELVAEDKQEESLLTGEAARNTIRDRLSSWASIGPGFVVTSDKWAEAIIYSANTPWSVKCDGRHLEIRMLGDVNVEGGYDSSVDGGPSSFTISDRVPKGRCKELAQETASQIRDIFIKAQDQGM